MTESTSRHPSRRRRGALGATAGLLGGSAVGLMLTVPSFTSAASGDAGTETVFASDDGERPDVGSRVRDALEDLVDDGTISAEQADAVAEHLGARSAERPERGRHGRVRDRVAGRFGDRGAAFDGEVVAELIGIDAEALRSELRAGATVAEIAEDHGVDVQVIIDALVDEASDHLELAVDDGRLTADEAANRLAEFAEHVTDRVNGIGPSDDSSDD